MTFFSILVALIIEQLKPLRADNQVYGGIKGFAMRIEGWFNAGEQKNGRMGWILMMLALMLPTSMRVAGLAVDQSRFCPRDFPIQQISAPTLVIHARDDTLVLYAYGQHSAEQIPNAEFMTIEVGGHFLLEHYAEIREATTAFLSQHQAEARRVEVH